MPLLDHFHPPLEGRRHGESFHGWWAAEIAGLLNEHFLPPEYFAEIQVSHGTRIEVDVGTFTEESVPETPRPNGAPLAVQTQTWAPPAPVGVMPAVFPDDFAVHGFSSEAGSVLVAAIELVSPGNKGRDESRRAFAVKCAAYLQRGVGLAIVDVVTSRHANLHDELISLLGHDSRLRFPEPTPLYATAYRPVHRQERNEIDLWRESLTLDQPLPTLPLAVRGLGSLPIELERTYMATRKRSRIG